MRKYSKHTEALASAVASLQEQGHVGKWLQESLEHSRTESIQWFAVPKKSKERPNLYLHLAALLQNGAECVTPFSLQRFIFAFFCFLAGNMIPPNTLLLLLSNTLSSSTFHDMFRLMRTL